MRNGKMRFWLGGPFDLGNSSVDFLAGGYAGG